jgi:hypothetical protein
VFLDANTDVVSHGRLKQTLARHDADKPLLVAHMLKVPIATYRY